MINRKILDNIPYQKYNLHNNVENASCLCISIENNKIDFIYIQNPPIQKGLDMICTTQNGESKPTNCPGSEKSTHPQEYIIHAISEFAYPSLVLFFHPSLNMLLYQDILNGKASSIIIYKTFN